MALRLAEAMQFWPVHSCNSARASAWSFPFAGGLLQTGNCFLIGCLPTWQKNPDTMRPQKFSPRADYRRQENQRIQESERLSKKFRELKSLTVELAYFSAGGASK